MELAFAASPHPVSLSALHTLPEAHAGEDDMHDPSTPARFVVSQGGEISDDSHGGGIVTCPRGGLDFAPGRIRGGGLPELWTVTV